MNREFFKDCKEESKRDCFACGCPRFDALEDFNFEQTKKRGKK